VVGALLVGSVVCLTAQESQPVFRVGAETVAVNVSVKKGSNPVLGLTAQDFRLFDNDVPQRVQAVSLDSVPLDVSLVVDTSGSAFPVLETARDAVRGMVALLRPADRFRVLTMGNAVISAIPWQQAGTVDVSAINLVNGQISLVHDSVLVALFHRTAPERRHLVVALSDDLDWCSLTSGPALLAAAERSGATFHWIQVAHQAGEVPLRIESSGAQAHCRGVSEPSPSRPLGEAARRTGGIVFTVWYGAERVAVETFDRVLDDFRRSYILHYEPQNVARSGWHRLRVEVSTKDVTVRARPGYWGMSQ
jgi:VWFA-related protein